MKSKNINLEIKKVILSELQGPDNPASKVIENILYHFMFLYSSPQSEANIMKIASQYTIAYLQLGFSYLEHKSLFDEVLQKAGLSQKQIAELQMQNSKIELNKSKIRSIIGRWNASSYNSHTISSAIDEIIRHVEKNELGSYQYYTAKKDSTYTALYQLTVTSSYALFHDVFNNKFYQLVKK